MKKQMKDLGVCAVIGGNGFLGSHIVKQLTENGHKVKVLDLYIPNRVNQNAFVKYENPSNIEYGKCDVTDYEQVYNALAGIETIFHCASIIDMRACPSPKMYDVNVNGTQNILRFCNDKEYHLNCTKRLIYTSSIDVLSNANGYTLAKETQLIQIKAQDIAYYNYAETKFIAEELILNNQSKNKDLCVSAIRIGALYGVGSRVLLAARDGFASFGLISLSRDSRMSCCSVENAACAHIQIVETLEINGNGKGECFHYKDFDTVWPDFMMEEFFEYKKEDIRHIPYFVSIVVAIILDLVQYIFYHCFGVLLGNPIGGISVYVINNLMTTNNTVNRDKFDRCIGYNPPYSVQESVKKVRAWARTIKC